MSRLLIFLVGTWYLYDRAPLLTRATMPLTGVMIPEPLQDIITRDPVTQPCLSSEMLTLKIGMLSHSDTTSSRKGS